MELVSTGICVPFHQKCEGGFPHLLPHTTSFSLINQDEDRNVPCPQQIDVAVTTFELPIKANRSTDGSALSTCSSFQCLLRGRSICLFLGQGWPHFYKVL